MTQRLGRGAKGEESDGEEKGKTDQRGGGERKYQAGQVRWTQMMGKGRCAQVKTQVT